MEKNNDKKRFECAKLHLQVGDTITSKKGILVQGALSEGHYLSYRLKYLGNNNWEQMGDKREQIDVKEVKK